MAPFLGIPQELQIRIVQHLDGRTLLAFREASTAIRELVDDTLGLRYQLALACAGMVDGPPSSTSIRDRLEALQAYREAWDTGAHPLYDVTITGFDLFTPNATSLVWPERTTGRFIVHRLPAAFRVIEERVDAFHGWGTLERGDNYYVVSGEQDLFVYTQGRASSNLTLGFYSLSQQFLPHPLASKPTIRTNTRLPVTPLQTRIKTQVVGDLVSWGGHHDRTEMLVVNWKTGIIVWHMYGGRSQHVRLLDSEYVAVVDEADLTLRLYHFDPSASTNCAVSDMDSDRLCLLLLPPRTPENIRSQRIDSTIGHPPLCSEDMRPLFMHDPSLTVFVLDITLTWQETPHVHSEEERFILFIPLETIHWVGAEMRSTGSSVLPWDGWGPSGARMVRIAPASSSPSALGAQTCIWIQHPQQSTAHLATVYEVFPLANMDLSGNIASTSTPTSHGPHHTSSGQDLDSDWLKAARCWNTPVETTHPFRTTTRFIAPENPPAYRSLRLAQEGFAVMRYRYLG